MHRDKFPETVPFRLTRMLVNAMGVGGLEGHFRCTCERVMCVLRRHKDSVRSHLGLGSSSPKCPLTFSW
jgi:FKBP12-rapamycin complex-associated protein